MNHLLVTSDCLNSSEAQQLATSPSCGAISLFVGTTRNNFSGKGVVQLEYEAYEPMAIKQMENVCLELRSKWPDVEHIVLQHRVGIVPVSEASVVVAVSSPHRAAAIAAAAAAIDAVKTSVPIWKKELYEDGTCSWKENRECPWKN